MDVFMARSPVANVESEIEALAGLIDAFRSVDPATCQEWRIQGLIGNAEWLWIRCS
jgi:hypothetical protein